MANHQTDLSLRWAHMSFFWFWHAAAHFVLKHANEDTQEVSQVLQILFYIRNNFGARDVLSDRHWWLWRGQHSNARREISLFGFWHEGTPLPLLSRGGVYRSDAASEISQVPSPPFPSSTRANRRNWKGLVLLLFSGYNGTLWASSRENLSSGFPTRVDSIRPAQPQKLEILDIETRDIIVSLQRNKGANQTARMRRLICTFVVHIWLKQVFLWRGSYSNSVSPLPRNKALRLWGTGELWHLLEKLYFKGTGEQNSFGSLKTFEMIYFIAGNIRYIYICVCFRFPDPT